MERGKGRGLNYGYSSIYSIGKNRRSQQKRQKEELEERKPRERLLLVTFWLLASNWPPGVCAQLVLSCGLAGGP